MTNNWLSVKCPISYKHLSESMQAAIKRVTDCVAYKEQASILHSSGGWVSEIRVLAPSWWDEGPLFHRRLSASLSVLTGQRVQEALWGLFHKCINTTVKIMNPLWPPLWFKYIPKPHPNATTLGTKISTLSVSSLGLDSLGLSLWSKHIPLFPPPKNTTPEIKISTCEFVQVHGQSGTNKGQKNWEEGQWVGIDSRNMCFIVYRDARRKLLSEY